MLRLLLPIVFLFTMKSFGMSPNLRWDINKAIDEAVIKYGLKVEPELRRFFSNSKTAYPPREIALLAFKHERRLELWARNHKKWQYIHTYPLTAFSGHLGPKLRENDGQIPEGIYRLIAYNPYSTMHLSIMLDYPNHFDRTQAMKEGRTKLGGNIFLHGKASSAGCLAVGNKAIDQLFLLARRVGLNHIRVIIAPNDLRTSKPRMPIFSSPKWLPELYRKIGSHLSQFPCKGSSHGAKLMRIKSKDTLSHWKS